MATKKNAAPEAQNEHQAETVTEKATPEEPMVPTGMEPVTVHLPMPTPGEEPYEFVGLNGQSFYIKKGADVEVPAAVKEILDNAEGATRDLYQFLDDNQPNFAK